MSVLGPLGVAFVAFVGVLLTLLGVVGVVTGRSEPFVFGMGIVCAALGLGVLGFLCAGLA